MFTLAIGRPPVWRTRYTLPASPGPQSLPRFDCITGRLFHDVNWKHSAADNLNADFIRTLVQSVEETNVSLEHYAF